MADYGCGEKQSIKDSVKFLKKYGSTCNHLKKPEYLVTHVVQKNDTLQGLALKYNTTMEQIRRINRLYASDSLFLRDHLKIPVNKEVGSSFEANNSDFESTSHGINPSVSSDSLKYEEEKTISDLFGKIDTSIASTRAMVKQVQEQSSFLAQSGIAELMINNHYLKSHQPCSSAINSSDILATPNPVVLNRGRKVKSSLQRLEKEQDELFEL
ncbi:hypothetical protein RUM44_000785 [Polyplax serrata]|uniref:LysM domain-containing protein n=1 Tax=Polyplax serrata TaxID=468196 RepID=A0ABR1B8M2_POLSC